MSSDRKGAPRLRDVLADRLDAQETRTLLHDIDTWLADDLGKAALERAEEMSEGLPAGTALQGSELVSHVRSEIGNWIEQVAGRWSSIQHRYELAETEQATADTEELKSRALGRMKWADGEKKRYLDRLLVESLSRAAVIPTYSHRQDSCLRARTAKCLVHDDNDPPPSGEQPVRSCAASRRHASRKA